MMKKAITYSLIVITSLMLSCKKQALPEAHDDSPKFYFTGSIDGSNVDLEAGRDKFYMFASTYFDSLYGFDVYKGELKQITCPGPCNYGLAVFFNDVKTGSQPLRVDSALILGDHLYNDITTEPSVYTATFVPSRAYESTTSYTWIISDGNTSTTSNNYSVVASLGTGKKYTVTLKGVDAQGTCSFDQSTEYRVGNPLQAEVNTACLPPGTDFNYSFSAKVKGVAPFSYAWDFGDGSPMSSIANPTHKFISSSSAYQTKLRIIDAAKDTVNCSYQVVAATNNTCEANFRAMFKPVINPKVYASVTVILTDVNGDVYTTKGFAQPATSRFTITGREGYNQQNELGELTRKVTVNLNCVVKMGNKSKTISSPSSVFAVSYK